MTKRSLFTRCALTAIISTCFACTSHADDKQLQKRLEDAHGAGTDLWVYNDIEAARLIALTENKPLFVTFRCVPCKACSSFDAEVAKGSQAIARLAREGFISVRQVEMKGVDLTQFQFDHDLNWAAMFINADGTVYARYGTQSADGPDAFNSIEGLQQTMKRVLELHENYPNNKAELAGKRAKQKPYKTALEMPGLPGSSAKFQQQTTRRNCIHCHMIHDAENEHAQKSGTFKQDMLWRYPLPNNIGLVVDAKHGRRIAKVEPFAKASGLQAGDEITHLNGQAITSIADMQWVLHNLPNKPEKIDVKTAAGKTRTIAADAGWKKSDISWRGSIWTISPRMRVWAPEAPANKRRGLNLADSDGALEVRWINGGKPGGRAARDSGLRQGDIIVAVDGKPVPNNPSKFQLHVKLNYKVGQSLPLTVVRGGKRISIDVKLVE